MLANFWSRRVGLDDLKQAYAQVEHGLYQILEKSPADWIPADVYIELRQERAFLYMCYVGDEYAGFYILTEHNDLDVKSVFVWCGYSTGKYRTIVEAAFSDIEARSEHIGAKYVEFGTKRMAWARRLSRLGYDASEIILRKELNREQKTKETCGIR